jgi:hypothetical protein
VLQEGGALAQRGARSLDGEEAGVLAAAEDLEGQRTRRCGDGRWTAALGIGEAAVPTVPRPRLSPWRPAWPPPRRVLPHALPAPLMPLLGHFSVV